MVVPGFWGSNFVMVVLGLTMVNILFVGGGSARMLHFMEEPTFCGTACHSVMNPEWTAYQSSPHANVACVECHVGEGAKALFDSKLNGAWQLVSVTFDLYEKPIPTPVHNLPPATETCGHCHSDQMTHGQRIVTKASFENDRESTPIFTSLALNTGKEGVHWHLENEVRYTSVEDELERVFWTEYSEDDGTWHRYADRRLTVEPSGHEHVRQMDCIDCHNRVAHVYEDPEEAVDQLIASGELDREVPFMKRTAMAAVTGSWRDAEMAVAAIEREVLRTTEEVDPQAFVAKQAELDSAVALLQGVYRRNIHHSMNVGWNSYPNNLGHDGERKGCFRCHNEDMVDEDGASMPHSCDMCHAILAWDSSSPFAYLGEADAADPDGALHEKVRWMVE
ncbi:MAG: cytochrome C [Proteobacteria bacterium]|nr:cytochrome C [Pseudomonadota bacterium]